MVDIHLFYHLLRQARDKKMRQTFLDLLARVETNPNYISPSFYDTAWLAWLYPQAQTWIAENQLPDGSWGSSVEYYQDRIICTLSAINALAATSTTKQDLIRIERGLAYLNRAMPCLKNNIVNTVAFELLLPGLIKRGENLGLPLGDLDKFVEPFIPLYYNKRSLILRQMPHDPQLTLVYALEFLGFDELDHSTVDYLRTANGSIHNSPSATAFVEIANKGSIAGRFYLDALLDKYDCTAPAFAPFELFEIVSTLHYLDLHLDLNSLNPYLNSLIDFLKCGWSQQGIGFSMTFLPDPINTSRAIKILNNTGTYTSAQVLETYEADKHYRCYPFERNISLEAHIHIIDALRASPSFPRQRAMLNKALAILKNQLQASFITDKWHISPYYSTAHAIMALTGFADGLITKQVKWLLETQRENGSWSYYSDKPQACIEETAFVLLALMSVQDRQKNIPTEVMDKGYQFIIEHYQNVEDLPAQWINKSLYIPYHIVEAVILTALSKYEYAIKNPKHIKSTSSRL